MQDTETTAEQIIINLLVSPKNANKTLYISLIKFIIIILLYVPK